MRSFASDNNSGVHPRVMDAIIKANDNHAVGYGDDPWTEAATSKIQEVFGKDASPFFVFNGTGANSVALQAVTRPFNSILCAETAHINVDECGAPARMTGCDSCVFCFDMSSCRAQRRTTLVMEGKVKIIKELIRFNKNPVFFISDIIPLLFRVY